MEFTDQRIDDIRNGASMLPEERTFLLEDTPRYEECGYSTDELGAMSDQDLMATAVGVWADYVRCMY